MRNRGILKDRNFTRGELVLTRDTSTVVEIMTRYLQKFGISSVGKELRFIELMISKLIDEAINKGGRVPLPHNLGYIQVLAHALSNTGHSVEHIKKYGAVDYSLLWIKHPLFFYHTFTFDKKWNDEVKRRVSEGMVYLREYVDGDSYVA